MFQIVTQRCVGKFIAGNNICVLRGSALTQIRLDGK